MKRLMVFMVALVLTCMSHTMASADLTDGLVGYYPFDGDARDHGAYGNHGEVYGATLVQDRFGNANSAYFFNGINDYIRIPDSNSMNMTGDLTISAWVHTCDHTHIIFSNMLEISPHDGYSLRLEDGKIRFLSGGEDFRGDAEINTGSWRHVAVTLSGSTATSYVDGLFDNEGVVAPPTEGRVDQTIGASYTPYYFFWGLIDDVLIYNRALSEDEIWELYNLERLPLVVAPLHDEDDLVMTAGDYSNFADFEYFDDFHMNHNGVDLALSPGGTKTASPETAGKTVHAICDGEVDFVRRGFLHSFVKIRHPDCHGQEVTAYYGHVHVKKGLTTVKRDDPIGTVNHWGGISHLHLTIDTQTARDLSRINYVVCDYQLDSNIETVISLSNCSDDTRRLVPNKMLLAIGWGHVVTLWYSDSEGRPHRNSLYISEEAMRQLGFISYFDLY